MAVHITVTIDLDVEVTETPMTLLNRLMGVLLTRKFAIGSRMWQYGSLDWWINFAEGKTSSIPPHRIGRRTVRLERDSRGASVCPQAGED